MPTLRRFLVRIYQLIIFNLPIKSYRRFGQYGRLRSHPMILSPFFEVLLVVLLTEHLPRLTRYAFDRLSLSCTFCHYTAISDSTCLLPIEFLVKSIN